MSLPVMLKQKYNKSLALGTIAASGCLGILIPPSIMLVIMGDQLSIPILDLFMGAVFPGLILGFLYIVYILIYCKIYPNKAPLASNHKEATLKDVIRALVDIIPPAGLILLVLGSIFMGIATVTEASAFGAVGAAIIAILYKHFNFDILKEVVLKTLNTAAYIFAIFVGATIFALVLRECGGDQLIESGLTGLGFGPYGIIIFVLVIVFFLGFFLDWIEITLIILPLLGPVITNLNLQINGFGVVDYPNLTWFALLVAVTLQTSFLTPPVGFALFYLKGVCPPNVTMIDIYRGVVPFIVIQLIALVLVFLFPELVTWLPSKAFKPL
jgi:tripartite ATP-independent transporter DctM subunit